MRDNKGRTPIFEALNAAQMTSFERLLKLKVDVQNTDNDGMNLVHHAVSNSKLFPFLKLLIARKTNPGVNVRTKRGDTVRVVRFIYCVILQRTLENIINTGTSSSVQSR